MEGENTHSNKPTVHKILADSYAMYLVLFLLGVVLDLVFKIKIYSNSTMTFVGFLFLVFASVLIFWAQKTSHDLSKISEVKKENFSHGPYCYTRSPTHWGLFFLMLGFGIVTNSFFVILTTFISFLMSKFTFLEKEEKILAEKYGAPYIEYKKEVKL